MKVTIELKAKKGDLVRVENYRSIYKLWEDGRIRRTIVEIDSEDKYHVFYDVDLLRRSKTDNTIRLCVGQERIERVEII